MAHKVKPEDVKKEITATEQQNARDKNDKETRYFINLDNLYKQLDAQKNELGSVRTEIQKIEQVIRFANEMRAEATSDPNAMVIRNYMGMPYGIIYSPENRTKALSAINNDIKGWEDGVNQMKVQEKFAQDKIKELGNTLQAHILKGIE